MRKIINIILIMAVLALGVLLAIGAETDKQSPKRPSDSIGNGLSKEETSRLLEIIWIWKLVDELELKEDQLTEFIPRFKELSDLKGKYYRDRRESTSKIGKLLKTDTSEDQFQEALAELRNLEIGFREKEKQLEKSLNSGLTIKQQAKFIVFQDSYRHDMRQLVGKLRELSKMREQPLKPQPKILKKQ